MSDREFNFECLMDTLDSILREISNRPTLRDQLAMAALTGLLCSGALIMPLSEKSKDEIAEMAWGQADAMLKARGE